MPRVPREVIEHRLAIQPEKRPVKQRLRRFALDRQEAIRAELDKLLEAGFIREVDFTSLNTACPKDDFHLPRIDQLVHSTAGCELMSFLDAYSGYHQISMAKEDEEKTAFITPFGVYCYVKMPFRLKNVGATYQRLMQKTFSSQLGYNLEIGRAHV